MKNMMMGLLLSSSVLITQTVFAENIHEPIIPAIAGLQSKALLLGFAKNQYELGMAYYEGKSIPRNIPKAVEWLNRASVKNYAPAKVTLAKMNLNGDGVTRNPQLAKQLLLQAAQKGNEEAQAMLVTLNTAEQKKQQQYSKLDSALLCQNWNTQNTQESPFYNQLAVREITGNAHKAIETSLKQSYTEQNQYKYYPEYKDSEGDTPDMRIFTPKSPNAGLFSKIETANHYGYGAKYQAIFRAGVDLEAVKQFIEQRDGVRFTVFNQSQIKQFSAEQKKLQSSDLDYEPMLSANNALKRKYNGLHVVHLDGNVKQISVSFKPRVEEDGQAYFVNYIALLTKNNGTHVLTCGVSEA